MKKSFWKRCNRGFIVSMVLLIVVILYVTVTQLMLMGEKRDIRDVCAAVDSMLAQHAQMSAEELAELKQKSVQETFKATVREKLKPYFVKDSAYLDDAVTSYVNTIMEMNTNEIVITALTDDGTDDSIRIDDNTAAVEYSHEYDSAGVWPIYQNDGTVVEGKTQTGTAVCSFTFSMKQEGGDWKIYRASRIAFYSY